ncbi:CGNR zinc finger domain-containing protein [Actinospica durhamensis]|nr:CGNR zinc finger domain-containing protein [Actinospica durhamensis]
MESSENSSSDAAEQEVGMHRWLALELAGTIRHDGNGGVADELSTPAQLSAWIQAQQAEHTLPELRHADTPFAVDEYARNAVVSVRTAVRALLARAVAPAAPSRADADRLPKAADALDHLNLVAARVPATLSLHWPTDPGHAPTTRFTEAATTDPLDRLTSILAREAMLFLADEDSRRLAACSAPRCVRYFLKEHGRQEYCKPSCSNRARVARHYQRRQEAATSELETGSAGEVDAAGSVGAMGAAGSAGQSVAEQGKP